MTVRPNRQSGVTLVELILSMVIISIALVGIFSVVNLTTQHSADPLVQHQAVSIAEAYLEEILLKSYSPGPGNTRADFDDVDDYHNLVDDGVQDQNGTPIETLRQYTVSVAVVAAAALPGDVEAKQITVSVSGPGVEAIRLVGYKADY